MHVKLNKNGNKILFYLSRLILCLLGIQQQLTAHSLEMSTGKEWLFYGNVTIKVKSDCSKEKLSKMIIKDIGKMIKGKPYLTYDCNVGLNALKERSKLEFIPTK